MAGATDVFVIFRIKKQNCVLIQGVEKATCARITVSWSCLISSRGRESKVFMSLNIQEAVKWSSSITVYFAVQTASIKTKQNRNEVPGKQILLHLKWGLFTCMPSETGRDKLQCQGQEHRPWSQPARHRSPPRPMRSWAGPSLFSRVQLGRWPLGLLIWLKQSCAFGSWLINQKPPSSSFFFFFRKPVPMHWCHRADQKMK